MRRRHATSLPRCCRYGSGSPAPNTTGTLTTRSNLASLTGEAGDGLSA